MPGVHSYLHSCSRGESAAMFRASSEAVCNVTAAAANPRLGTNNVRLNDAKTNSVF